MQEIQPTQSLLLESYYDRSSMQRGWSGDASMPTNGISLVTPTMTFLAGLKPLVGRGMITTVKTFWGKHIEDRSWSSDLNMGHKKAENPQYTIEQVKE